MPGVMKNLKLALSLAVFGIGFAILGVFSTLDSHLPGLLPCSHQLPSS
jgi:hypothetical protein